MISFLEAFDLFGRDSMAIAQAMGVDEPVAYNLIASRVAGVDRHEPTVMTLSRHRQNRERLREMRLAARGVAR